MRLMCFDYCLQIRSDQWNKTPQKQPDQSSAVLIWDPARGLSLLSAGLSEQLPAQQLLWSWERSQVSQSGIPNGSPGICPSLLDQGFLLPCPLSQHSQKGIAKFSSLTRSKRISSLLLGTRNPQVCSHYQTCSLNRCFSVAFLKFFAYLTSEYY